MATAAHAVPQAINPVLNQNNVNTQLITRPTLRWPALCNGSTVSLANQKKQEKTA